MTSTVGTCRLCSRLVHNLVRVNSIKAVASPSYQHIRGIKQFQEKTVRLMYWRGRSFDRAKIEHKRSDWQEWNYRSEIFAFSRRLQENLDETTLRQIFSHPSYVEKLRDDQIKLNLPELNIKPNTELIQIGHTLLDECVKPYLRFTFDKLPEDGILAITNYLKSDEVLADMAKWFGCTELILSTEYPPTQSMMADTVRALLAGINRDLGIERTRRFVVDMIISYLNDKDILDDVWIIPNPRETLNLILANSNLPNYEPRIMYQTGVHTIESCHMVGLYSDKKFLGSSAGETLKIAEECAVLDSLQRIFDIRESRRPFVYGQESEKIDYTSYNCEHHYVKAYQTSI